MLRIIRFVSMLLASFLGLYGVLIFFLILTIYTSSLRSFGVPYLSPYAPLKISDWKDFVLRAPWIDMKTRHFIIPMSIIITSLSFLVYDNIVEMTIFALNTWPFYAIIFEFIIPFILLLVALMKNKSPIN